MIPGLSETKWNEQSGVNEASVSEWMNERLRWNEVERPIFYYAVKWSVVETRASERWDET